MEDGNGNSSSCDEVDGSYRPAASGPNATLFDTQAEAEVAMAAVIAGGQRHVYVLPPVAAWGDRPTVGTWLDSGWQQTRGGLLQCHYHDSSR
jgi:hypothetical protein